MTPILLQPKDFADDGSGNRFFGVTGKTFLQIFLLIVGAFILFSTLASAANNNSVPSSADPARQNKTEPVSPRFDLQEPTILQSTAPELSPDIAILRFTLNSLTVRGSQAFDQAQLLAIYSHSLGKEISVAELFAILNSIQQLYLDEGYSLSKVSMPEQNIQGGNIVFDVVEGYIGSIEVDDELPDVPMIDALVSNVLAMRPLNVKKLERMMLLINDRPGVKLTSVLASIESAGQEPGAIKLILKDNQTQEDKSPISGALEINNYGSVFAGSGQMEGSVQIHNTGINLSDLRLNTKVTSSSQELRQGSFEYTQPVLGISGTQIKASGTMSNAEPGGSLDILDVRGVSRSLRVGVEYPVIRQRDQNLMVSTGFNYQNSKTDLLGDEIINDRLRIVDVGVNYSAADRFSGFNFLNLSLAKGFNVFNASNNDSPTLSRQDGRNDFTKLTPSYSRLQPLTQHFDLFCSVIGQYSPTPLLSSEEFGYGGMGIGRGYDSSEITGDRGFSASVELKYLPESKVYGGIFQPYLFYDFGKVWNIDSGASDKISGASAGAGFRYEYNKNLSFDALLAAPLTLEASNPPKYTDEDGLRFLFRLKKSFSGL